jgi:hypothetical protein
VLVHASKEGAFLVVADPGRCNVGVDVFFGVVARRHLVAFAALLVEPKPPALAILVVIRDAHMDGGTDTREGVAHQGDERPVSQADNGIGFNRIKKCAGLVRFKNGSLALVDDVLGATNRRCRIHWHYLARDQPIEEHSNRGEVLLDGGRCAQMILNVGGDVNRTNGFKRKQCPSFAPCKKLGDGFRICGARVAVPDIRGEEFNEPPRRALTGARDRCRKFLKPRPLDVPLWNRNEALVHSANGRRSRCSYSCCSRRETPKLGSPTTRFEIATPAWHVRHSISYHDNISATRNPEDSAFFKSAFVIFAGRFRSIPDPRIDASYVLYDTPMTW